VTTVVANVQATVALDLRDIVDMASRLEARAMDRANDRTMPGGEAMVNLAGVGSMRDWQRRIDLGERLHDLDPRIKRPDITNEDPDQLWPAVQVLWYWSEGFRDQLGHDHEDPKWRPTLVSEAQFLANRDVASWVHNHLSELNRFGAYAADVARAKGKLEGILREGERAELTPVVCNRCEDGRPLVRVYDQRRPVLWACAGCLAEQDHPDPLCARCGRPDPLVACHWTSDPNRDRYKCMGCKHLFDVEELADARATQIRRSTPREWTPRAEAVALLRDQGHPRPVAERIVDSTEVRSWCEVKTRTRWVSWPDAWRRHMSEVQARLLRRARSRSAS
jgi:hypothetical protein